MVSAKNQGYFLITFIQCCYESKPVQMKEKKMKIIKNGKESKTVIVADYVTIYIGNTNGPSDKLLGWIVKFIKVAR